MPSIASLIKTLQKQYPNISFVASDTYAWVPTTRTIHYNGKNTDKSQLLHELSHGILNHDTYSFDIELLTLEREAWDKAKDIAQHYGITLAEEDAENHLDSYREWLHARATCPACSATGFQTKKTLYSCPACHASWRVNEAKTCALRRYTINK